MLCGATNLCGPLFLTGDETVDERREMFMGPVLVLSNLDGLEFRYFAKLLQHGYSVLAGFKCERELCTQAIHLLYRLALLFTTPVDGVISRAEKKKIPLVGCPLFEELEETLHSALRYFERFTHVDFREHLLVGLHPQAVFVKFEIDIIDLMDKFKTTFKIKAAFATLLESQNRNGVVVGESGDVAVAGGGGATAGARQQYLPLFQCDFRESAMTASASTVMMDRVLAKKRFATSREVESFIRNMKDTSSYVNEAVESTNRLLSPAGAFSIIRQQGMLHFWQEYFATDFTVTLSNFCEKLKSSLVNSSNMTPENAQRLLDDCSKGPFKHFQGDTGQIDIVEVSKLSNVLPRCNTDMKQVLTSLLDYCSKHYLESQWVKRVRVQKSDSRIKQEVFQHKKTKELRTTWCKPPCDDLICRIMPPVKPMVSFTASGASITEVVPPQKLIPLPPLLPLLGPVDTNAGNGHAQTTHLPDAAAAPVHVFWNLSQEKLLTAACSEVGWLVVAGPRKTGKSTRLLSILQKDVSEDTQAPTSREGNGKEKKTVIPSLAMRDKIFVDFWGTTSDAEGRSRLATQLSLKYAIGDNSSLMTAFSELLSTLRPNSVVVLDNFDSLTGLAGLVKPNKSSKRSSKFKGSSGGGAGIADDSLGAINSDCFAYELLDVLRSWQATFCIVLVVHMEAIRSDPSSDGAVGPTPKPKLKPRDKKTKDSDGSEDSDIMPRGHDQFQIPGYVEQALGRLPQKRKFVVPPLSHKPALALARSLQLIDAEALVLAGRYLPAEMTFLHRYCSLKTIRTIASMRTKEMRWETATTTAGVRGGPGADNNTTPPAARDSSSTTFSLPLGPGTSVRRLWDVTTNLILGDIVAQMSPDELLAANAVIPGTPPISEACGWALCREVFSGDLLRWRLAFRGLVRCGWLIEMGDLGFVTFAPLGYIVPVPVKTGANSSSTSSGPTPSSSLPPLPSPPPPPPPPRRVNASTNPSRPNSPAPADEQQSNVDVFERRGSLYLHYWASELSRIDILCSENSTNSIFFDLSLQHLRVMLASLVASTLAVDMRGGGKLQGEGSAGVGAGLASGDGTASGKEAPLRKLSFGRSLSPTFSLQGNIGMRDESELEIPLFFVPDPSALGTRLAGHLSKLLGRLPPNEAVCAARAVVHHVVEASPQKDSFEYLEAGTDLGEQLRRAGQSLEGCAIMRNIVNKFPISLEEEDHAGAFPDKKNEAKVPPLSELKSLVANKPKGSSPQQRSAVARALFIYSTLLHATSRQPEALEYSQKAIRLWESCPPSPELRQRILLATSREMVLGNSAGSVASGSKCGCALM